MHTLLGRVAAATKLLALLGWGLVAMGAHAAQLQVLVDTDNNSATGCTVPASQ